MTARSSRILVAALAVVAATAYADNKAKTAMKGAAKAEPVIVNPNEITWTDAPPDLPKGAQMTVLHGDPTKSGQYAMRIKAPDGYKIPPHWHTRDEQLTILSGSLRLHMGDTMEAPAHDLGVGAYHFLPGKMHHAAEMKGETIVQINGEGPFDIHYLNAADNPNPKTAKK